MKYAQNECDALLLMQDKAFDPSVTAIVESSDPIGILSENSEQDDIEIISHTATSVTIKCTMKSNGLLILSDLFYPGWHAYVNGEKTHIWRTNDVMRGIYLNEGSYEIEFSYKPLPLYIGCLISLFTLLSYIIAFAIWNKKINERTKKL